MQKKYELVKEHRMHISGKTLYRIKALTDIQRFNVKKGDLGGYIEKESNLSQSDDCWICATAKVYGDALVSGNALIAGNARIYGHALVCGYALIGGNAKIYDNAIVSDYSRIDDDVWIYDNAFICGKAHITDNSQISKDAYIRSDNDYVYIRGFDPENSILTFYRTKNDNVRVESDNIIGTLEEFIHKVNSIYKDTKYYLSYLSIIDAIKHYFE